jgi:hypothetical protein
MSKIKIFAVMASFAFSMAFAQQSVIVNVAVIETEVDAEPVMVKEFKPSELRYMTQEIRRQTINNLPKSKYFIIAEQPQDNPLLQKCANKNCMVSLGEKIGADLIARGVVNKFRKNYVFTVEIYNATNGMLILSSSPVESEKAEELLSGFREVAPAFFKRLDDELKRMESDLIRFRKIALVPSFKQVLNNSNVVCKTEIDKAKSIYDECLKMDKASGDYAKCTEDYKNQKEKAEQVCNE